MNAFRFGSLLWCCLVDLNTVLHNVLKRLRGPVSVFVIQDLQRRSGRCTHVRPNSWSFILVPSGLQICSPSYTGLCCRWNKVHHSRDFHISHIYSVWTAGEENGVLLWPRPAPLMFPGVSSTLWGSLLIFCQGLFLYRTHHLILSPF